MRYALLFLLAAVAVQGAEPLAPGYAQGTPRSHDCMGYSADPSLMADSVKKEIDAVNLKYRQDTDDIEEQFAAQTGEAGKQWSLEYTAILERSNAAHNRVKWPDIPSSKDAMDEAKMQEFQLAGAKVDLTNTRISNRESEEQAEAVVRFVERGGNVVFLNSYKERRKQLFEFCQTEDRRIYKAWWAAQEKP
jgi:hypothetical protein